jgi:hypothetical protein
MSFKDKLSGRIGAGIATVLVGGAAGAFAIAPAQATTGNADGLPEPKVLVNPSIGDAYIGRFYLARIDRRAGIESAVLDIDYTESVEHEFMVGDGEFYQYNKQGSLTSWTASLYPFEYTHGLMSCNLLVPGTTTQVLGKIVMDKPSNLDTPTHPNQETINVKLTIGSSTYAATFSQVEDDNPTPASLPKAVETGSGPVVGTEPPIAESPTTAPVETTGVYASVVKLTNSLS